MNLPLFIAKRYLFSKKSHNAINIITGISIGSVAIITSALVIILSAFNGLSDLVQSLYNRFDADIEITITKGKAFDPNSTAFDAVKKIDGVVYFTEVVEGNALLKFNDKQCISTIKGVSNNYEKMGGIDSFVKTGNFNLARNNVVIGQGISYVLQLSSKDQFTPISIYAPKRGTAGSINPEDGFNELKAYSSGEFSINDEFDYKYTLMSIENARTLLDYANEVTSVELGLKKDANKLAIQDEIKKVLGEEYVVKNREEQNEMLFKTLKSEKLWTFIILGFILIIATFNIIGSLTMLIIEKKKDIGILYSMGATIKTIRKIFLLEGLLITGMGTLIGLFIGLYVCLMQMKFSLIKFSEGYVVEAYPISMRFFDFVLITAAVMTIGLFAAWYPVRVFTKKHLLV